MPKSTDKYVSLSGCTDYTWLCAVYRIIQYEKYGHEGTGFFHNRLEVMDTATCLQV